MPPSPHYRAQRSHVRANLPQALRSGSALEAMRLLYGRQDVEVLFPSEHSLRAQGDVERGEPFALRVGDWWILGHQRAGRPVLRRWAETGVSEREQGLQQATSTVHGPYDLIAALDDLWRFPLVLPTRLEYDLGWQILATLDSERRESARTAIALSRGVDLAGQMANYQHHKHRAAEVADAVRQVGHLMGIDDIEEDVEWAVDRLLCSPTLDDLESQVRELLVNSQNADGGDAASDS